MLNKFVFVYLDGILIFSRSETEYIQHVRTVLQRLLQNQLFLKAENVNVVPPLYPFWASSFLQAKYPWTPAKSIRSRLGPPLRIGSSCSGS